MVDEAKGHATPFVYPATSGTLPQHTPGQVSAVPLLKDPRIPPSHSDTVYSFPHSASDATSSHSLENATLSSAAPISEYTALSSTTRTSAFTLANPDRSAASGPSMASGLAAATHAMLALTPAQRKAAEAASEGGTRPLDLTQHKDSGYRFDQEAGDSGGAPSSPAEVPAVGSQELPSELPPVYSES